MHGLERSRQPWIGRAAKPCRRLRAGRESAANAQHDQHVQQPVEHRLPARRCMGQLARQQRHHAMNGIVDARGDRQQRWQRSNQARADVASEAIGSAEEDGGARVTLILVERAPTPEFLRQRTRSARLVRDEMVRPATHQRQIPGAELERLIFLTVYPQPRMPLDNGMHRKLDRARQQQAPRRDGDRPCEYAAGSAGANQMLLKYVHYLSVSRILLIQYIIDTLDIQS